MPNDEFNDPHDDTGHEDDAEEGADAEALVACPYCGESCEIVLDPSGGTTQDYVEDCSVCCQPWRVHVRWRSDGRADVRLDTANG